MPLDPVKVDVAQRITARFLNMRQASPRKPLAVLIRDGGILDEMENRSLVRAAKNRTEYFPTFSTFAILNEDDAKYIKARDGVLKVLHTLTNLYEVDESPTQYTLEQLIERARARYDSIDADEISLGLYLVVSDFGAIQSFGRSPDGTQITSFTIAEGVLKVADPTAAWARRAAIARNNASAPTPTFEALAKMKFEDAVSELYEPVIEHNRGLTKQYQNAGIAEAGNFARQAADVILNAFRQVEQIFRSTYLDGFARGLDPLMEMQLRQILEVTLTEQTTRAQGVARDLCMSFVTPVSDRFTAIDAQVRDTGSRMKERLNNTITLHAAQGFAPGDAEESSEEEFMEPDTSEETNGPSVFISYAWESEEFKRWVLEFAKHLRSKGVNVTLDRWDLGLGDNRFQFMEQSVTRAEFVLVICTPTYVQRSEERSGGVGYESNIITGRIAEKAGKQKFIPVLRSGDWKTAVPAWLKFAVGCDLSGEPYRQDQFQELLKTLHRKNASAPTLGPVPAFVEEEASQESTFVKPVTNAARFVWLDLPEELTVKEHELLDAAVHDPDEQICYLRYNGTEQLAANGKSFLEAGGRRARAAWLGALRALEQRGLIEPASADRSAYHVTDAGYKASDRLGAFIRWKTNEILLEALYMNADEDSLTIKCSGVVEVPATFYPDDVGADRHVMRSLKQDRSLWVEGVERGAIDDIRWKPTDVSFTNEETGERVEFRVRGITGTPEAGCVLLETVHLVPG
jgi:TIR domain